MQLGVDLGGTKCVGVLLDDHDTVLATTRQPTPKGRQATPEAMTATVLRVIEDLDKLATDHGVTGCPVGVGIPGLVDAHGRLAFGPNLDRLSGWDAMCSLGLGLEPSRRLVIDNDANCHARAETLIGAAADKTNVLVVMLGTGIGGGLVVDGEIRRGANGFAGEIGHFTVDQGGSVCACGRIGCWETIASGRGLALLAREAALANELSRVVELAGGDAESVRGEHVTTAAGEGDAEALAVLQRFAQNVALGLANLVQIFDPELIVIGGGIIRDATLVVPPIQDALTVRLRAPAERYVVPVVAAKLGELAGAIGAGLAAR
jgi:glucokinase